MKRNHTGVRARRGLLTATLIAAAATTVVVLNLDDRLAAAPSPDLVLSNYAPVAEDEGIVYDEEEIPVPEGDVGSVGTTDEGTIVVTMPEDELDSTVSIYPPGADGALAVYYDVRGIALSDPGGTLSAWIEVTETETETISTVVAVDTSTGQELGRLPVNDLTTVMAVRGNTVALSDDDTSHLWTTGSEPQQVAYVPDDYYIVGLTEDRVIASDLDVTTSIYDRADGSTIATIADLSSWDTNIAGDEMAGATLEGNARLVDLASGSSTLLNPTVEAGTASFSDDGAVVITELAELSDTTDEVSLCDEEQVCASMAAEGEFYFPNEALGQLGSQSY